MIRFLTGDSKTAINTYFAIRMIRVRATYHPNTSVRPY